MAKSKTWRKPKVAVDFSGKPKPGGGRHKDRRKDKSLSKNLIDRRNHVPTTRYR